MLRLLLSALLACLALVPSPSAAQTIRAVHVLSDNDAYNFWIPAYRRPDHGYTNGMAVTLDFDGAPGWARRLLPGAASCGEPGCVESSLRVGQEIYTAQFDSTLLVPGDRPFAGWLSVAGSVRASTPRVQRALGAEVGVTGPPSLGEAVHRTWHSIAGFYAPDGWRNQLKFEPGIVMRYDERHLVGDAATEARGPVDLVLDWGAEAGNIRTGAHGGARLRAGVNLPHPWRAQAKGWSAHAFAGARGDVVLRNLFLDGNTFVDGPSVDRKPLVGQWEAGVGVRSGRFSAEYRAVGRSREFDTQQQNHPFGGITLTLALPTR